MPGNGVAPLGKIALLVLDSVGIGGAPDAHRYGDEGSATLPHVAAAVGGLAVPNLQRLGLGNLASIEGVPPADHPTAAWGSLTETSPGKDTTTGHWELAGVVLERAFPTYPEGFPDEIIERFEAETGTAVLGNEVASGTEIIARLGDEHRETGRPIVYTSADSVFQVAAHVDVVPLERLYEMCRTARSILTGEHEVGRVIARPFAGEGTEDSPFERTPDRHDFAVPPPRTTLLDVVTGSGLEVWGVGKIADIFAGRGVTSSRPTRSNEEGVEGVLEALREPGRGLIFANLVDFDQSFGHRNDPEGYAEALLAFDGALPRIVGALGPEDALFITADHGNDPTTPSTDHSRERVPLLVTGDRIRPVDLGTRSAFTDCGRSIADLLGLASDLPGESFAAEVLIG